MSDIPQITTPGFTAPTDTQADVYDDRYKQLRQFIFEKYQHYFNSNDHIPVVRVLTAADGVKRNNYKSGRTFFRDLRSSEFGNHPNYNCNVCKTAFEHLTGIWFIDRTGAHINPMKVAYTELGLQYVDPSEKIKGGSVEYQLIKYMPRPVGVGEVGGFTHFQILTPEQLVEWDQLDGFDTANSESVAKRILEVHAGYDPQKLHIAIKQIAGTDDALYMLTLLGMFAEEIKGIHKSIILKFINQKLRHKKWNTLRHFSSSLAGSVFDSFVEGNGVESIADFYLSKIDPAKYKQKQVDASIGLLQQTRKALQEKQMTGILLRRPAVIGIDIAAVWGRTTTREDILAEVAPVETPENAANAAFEKLINKAKVSVTPVVQKAVNDLERYNPTFDDVVSGKANTIIKPRIISMAGFLAKIKDVKRIALVNSSGASSHYAIMTVETEDTPTSKDFFKPEKSTPSLNGQRTLTSMMTVKPLNRSDVLTNAEVAVTDYCEIEHIYKDVENFMMAFKGNKQSLVNFNARRGDEQYTIIGPEIRNELYHMAAAIRDITSELGMQAIPELYDGCNIAVGFIAGVGDRYIVENTDNSVEYYIVTSDI